MDGPSLFDVFDDPPAQRHVPTSVAAADAIAPAAGRLRALVLGHVARRGAAGATCDECEVALGMRHQTCSARVRELAKAGLVTDSGRTRPTRSGRKAVVWVAVRPAQEG